MAGKPQVSSIIEGQWLLGSFEDFYKKFDNDGRLVTARRTQDKGRDVGKHTFLVTLGDKFLS
jgi:hypothetical protein